MASSLSLGALLAVLLATTCSVQAGPMQLDASDDVRVGGLHPDDLTKNLYSKDSIWPSSADGTAIIKYKFTVYDGAEVDKASYRRAMDDWEAGTCLKFQEMSDGEDPTYYMELFNDASKPYCYAYHGPGKPTRVSTRGACGYTGYLHELAHALSLVHEQSRSDRDDYIYSFSDRFSLSESINYDVPFDHFSIVKYTDNLGTTGEQRHIIVKDPRFQYIPNGDKISFMNVKLMNRILSCDKLNLKTCKKETDPCQNQGYLGKDCKCACPPGTKGEDCEVYEMSYNDAMIKEHSNLTRIITEPNTVIQTPGYPLKEAAPLYTLWLKAPKCQRAVLTFEDFCFDYRSGVNDDGSCNYDALEIRTKFIKMDYDNFCQCNEKEIKKGQVFKSEENDIILHVKLSGNKNFRGFKALFTLEPIENCSA